MTTASPATAAHDRPGSPVAPGDRSYVDCRRRYPAQPSGNDDGRRGGLRTEDYLARRLRQGKSKKEAIRCLKHHVAREVFAVLHDEPQLADLGVGWSRRRLV
jgi:hypothetical protein